MINELMWAVTLGDQIHSKWVILLDEELTWVCNEIIHHMLSTLQKRTLCQIRNNSRGYCHRQYDGKSITYKDNINGIMEKDYFITLMFHVTILLAPHTDSYHSKQTILGPSISPPESHPSKNTLFMPNGVVPSWVPWTDTRRIGRTWCIDIGRST